MQKVIESEGTSFEIRFSRVQSGLDFLLSHFSKPLFPRTISRTAINKRQYEVDSADTALYYYRVALLADCRINAFYVGQTNPDLIFFDLDNDKALEATLRNIDRRIGGHPSVILSGSEGCYHVIQPIRCPLPLEEIKEFADLESLEASKKFLQYAERYLSGGLSDPLNHPALKSCLLRVPGSINSKNNAEVQVLQTWDGYRPYYGELSDSFLADLKKKKNYRYHHYDDFGGGGFASAWIEKLLQTPLANCRKYALSLILSRYLINVKKVGYDQAYAAIWEWLDKCQQLKRLEPSRSYFDHYIVKYQLAKAQHNQRLPMNLETLKEKNPDLYETLELDGNAKEIHNDNK